MKPEITSNGTTVWVNTAICIGRFGIAGIDVHKDWEGQMEDGSPCLDCIPASGDHLADWERFKASMKTHHNVEIPEKHRPKWVG